MTPTRRELHRCMKLAYAKGVAAGEARVLKGLSAIGHLNGAAPAVLKARDAVGHEHRGKGPHGGEFTGTRGGGASGKVQAATDSGVLPRAVKKSPTKSKADVRYAATKPFQRAEIDEVFRDVLGTDDAEDIASVVGAPDDAEVKVDWAWTPDGKGKRAKVTIEHADFTAVRYIGKYTSNGKTYIRNDEFWVKPGAQGKGLGAEVFARQVENAAELGVDYIVCHAAKENPNDLDKPHNGYYTWPRFGYDQSLSEDGGGVAEGEDQQIYASARERFPGAKTVLDIMATPEGRDWWKANGTDMLKAVFDVSEGSRSRTVLESYLVERVASKKSTSRETKSLPLTGHGRPETHKKAESKSRPATRAAALLAWAAECEATGTDPTPGFDAILDDDDGDVIEKAWSPHLHPRDKSGRFIGRDRLQAAHANPGGKDAKQLRKDVKPEDRAKLEAVLSQGLDAVGRTQRGESKHRAQAKRAARALTKSAAMALVSKFADGSGTAEDVRALADHLKATWAEGGLSKDHLDLLQNVLGGGGRKRQEMVESLLAIARQATEPKAEPPTDADQDEAMDLARRQRQNAERQDREGIDPRPPLPTDDRDTERYDAARDKLSRMQGWAADKPHSLAAQEAVNRAAGRVEGTKQPTGVGTSAVSAGQPKEAEPTANPKESPVPRSAAQAAEESVLPPSTPPGLTPAEHRAQVKQVRTAARTAELTRRKDAGARREAERVAKRTPAEAPGLTTAKKELAAATPDSLAHRALDAAVDNITAMPADRYRDETPDRAALRHNRDVAGHLTSAWAAAHRLGAKPEELAPIERAMHAHGMEPVGTAGETVPHDAKYHDVGPAAGGSPPSGTPVTVGRPGWHLKEPGGDIYQTARANIVKSAGNPLTAGGIASAMHRDATAFTASAPLLPAPDLAKRREQLSAGIGRMNLPEPVKADLHARMAAATTSQQQAAIHTEALARLEGRWQKKARDAVGHEHRGKGPHGGEFTGTRGGAKDGKLRRSRIRRRLDPGEPSVATNSPSDRANTSVEADPAVVATAEKWVAGSPGLPDHLKARYTGHLTAVLSRMPPAARTLAIEPVESTMGGAAVFHPDAASLSAAASKITGRRESGVIGFVHESSSRGAQLHLDGGTESDNPKVSQETYAHELWHCVDHGKVYSDRPKWQAAYKKDILKGRTLLSRYAMTNSAEGFAELGAAIHSKGAEYVKANFPTCWKFLEAEKLV